VRRAASIPKPGVTFSPGGGASKRTRTSSGARVEDPGRIAEDLLAFAAAFGVEMFPWQREAFGAACQRIGGGFRYRLARISVARGQGKSYAAAVVAIWRLVCGPV